MIGTSGRPAAVVVMLAALTVAACGSDQPTEIESGMDPQYGVTTATMPSTMVDPVAASPTQQRLLAFQAMVTKSPFNGGVDRTYPTSVEELASFERVSSVVTGTVLSAVISDPVPTELFEGQDEVLDGATLATINIDLTVLVENTESRPGESGTPAPGSQLVLRVRYEIGRSDQIGGTWVADQLRNADPTGARVVAVITNSASGTGVFDTGSYALFLSSSADGPAVAADAVMQPVVEGQKTDELGERAAGVLESRPVDE